MYPLYWHAGADFAVLSNRSLTVSDLVGSREWDPRNVKGFGGEFFRRGADRRYREKELPSVDELASQFATGHLEMDRLGIIRRRRPTSTRGSHTGVVRSFNVRRSASTSILSCRAARRQRTWSCPPLPAAMNVSISK
jgi:hypothetical protein